LRFHIFTSKCWRFMGITDLSKEPIALAASILAVLSMLNCSRVAFHSNKVSFSTAFFSHSLLIYEVLQFVSHVLLLILELFESYHCFPSNCHFKWIKQIGLAISYRASIEYIQLFKFGSVFSNIHFNLNIQN